MKPGELYRVVEPPLNPKFEEFIKRCPNSRDARLHALRFKGAMGMINSEKGLVSTIPVPNGEVVLYVKDADDDFGFVLWDRKLVSISINYLEKIGA